MKTAAKLNFENVGSTDLQVAIDSTHSSHIPVTDELVGLNLRLRKPLRSWLRTHWRYKQKRTGNHYRREDFPIRSAVCPNHHSHCAPALSMTCLPTVTAMWKLSSLGIAL